MTFTVDDYEKAIARIFDQQGHVIGTGFLVAPGYVMTCAHVVLQSIGVEQEAFPTYGEKPQEHIFLDFHVLASGQKIEAQVVAWLPYRLDSGDVVALKLLTPEPNGAKPIPLKEVLREEVKEDQHFVYGFGKSDQGGRSDAYKPKANVAGGRFQLCRFDNPDEETIKPGFSGAPVWNDRQKYVIGMVATAIVAKEEQKSTAYAIPTKELGSVLKKIYAFTLYDVLKQSLEACDNEAEKQKLQSVIETVLRRCNPNGSDCTWQEQLENLSDDRASVNGWEIEGCLVRFAMILARMDDTPGQTYDRLKDWVEWRSFNFPDLLDRATREMKQQKIPSSNVCQHLMVVVDPEEGSTTNCRVSMWAIADRESYDLRNPPQPFVHEETKTLSELPEFIRTKLRKKYRKEPVATIHLFVPRDLLCSDLEMVPIGTMKEVLGGEFPFVMRTNLKSHPIGYHYYDDWNEKWENLENSWETQTRKIFKKVDCSPLSDTDSDRITDLMATLEPLSAVMLEKCSSFKDLFGLIVDENDRALPVALWSRDPRFDNTLPTLLDCIVKTFPHRIQQERKKAKSPTKEVLMGHHLSLMWEDPKILPPDMQFDPEAC